MAAVFPLWWQFQSDKLQFPDFESRRSLADRLPFQWSLSRPQALIGPLGHWFVGQAIAQERPWGALFSKTPQSWLADVQFSPQPGGGVYSVSSGSGFPASPGALAAQPPALEANRIVVQWSPTSTAAERLAALNAIGGIQASFTHTAWMQQQGQGPVEVIRVPAGMTLEAAIRAYSNRPGVQLAEQDWVVGLQATATDPGYTNGSLWGMYSSDTPTSTGGSSTTNTFGSQAEQAWLRDYTGSSKVVVGVIDEGIDYRHPDLYLNIWLNPGEIPLNLRGGLTDFDNDGQITFRDLNSALNAAFVSDLNKNGYIDAGDLLADTRWENGLDEDGNQRTDDLIGWDFFNKDNDPYDGTGDDHATHVAGTIGAMGNNAIGVAGVNWNVQMMSLKFLGPNGGYASDAAAAVQYYADMTARYDLDVGTISRASQYVGTNNSWGGGGYLAALHTAIINGGRNGNLFVAAAGNSTANNDTTTNYPSNYSTLNAPSGTQPLTWEAVLAVASIGSNGALSSFSNFGATTVDLGAPGGSIYSTLPGDTYGTYSGTSMATPHVMGALALMAAAYPTATPLQLRQALLSGSTPTSSLSGKTVTGGRLNVSASLDLLGGGTLPPPPPSKDVWGTSGSDDYTGINGGGLGADKITGVGDPSKTSDSSNLGVGQQDAVTGNAAGDTFLLADKRGLFYNDGNSASYGTSDFLRITDFNSGEDKLQLKSGLQYLYRYVAASGSTPGYTEIYFGNGDRKFTAADELIARLDNVNLAPGTGVYIMGAPAWATFVA